jgi:hypothetical protein
VDDQEGGRPFRAAAFFHFCTPDKMTMAINKNHEFEDLNGIKCSIAARNVSAQRAEFLKSLLEHNGYTVVIVRSEIKPAQPAESNTPSSENALPEGELFTVGVTDLTFNPINAIYGRMLRTPDNKIVTAAYWNQQEKEADDSLPYFLKKQ